MTSFPAGIPDRRRRRRGLRGARHRSQLRPYRAGRGRISGSARHASDGGRSGRPRRTAEWGYDGVGAGSAAADQAGRRAENPARERASGSDRDPLAWCPSAECHGWCSGSDATCRLSQALVSIIASRPWMPAPFGITRRHAARARCERGLYGVLIVDEAAPLEVDRDIVLVFDERLLPAETIATQDQRAAAASLRQCRESADGIAAALRPPRRAGHGDRWPAGRAISGQRAAVSRLDRETGSTCFWTRVLEPGETASIFLDEAGSEKELARLVYDRGRKAAGVAAARSAAAAGQSVAGADRHEECVADRSAAGRSPPQPKPGTLRAIAPAGSGRRSFP